MVLRRYRKWKNIYVTAVFALLLSSLFIGVLIYINEKKIVTNEKINEIESISSLKSKQVSEWYRDETNDALIISQNSVLLSLINDLIKNDSNSFKDLQLMLRQIASQHDYKEIIIGDAENNILFSTNSFVRDSIQMKYTQKLRKIVYNTQVSSSGLYFQSEKEPVIDFITNPKVNGTQIILILRIDPKTYLFPLMSYTPVYEKTFVSEIVEFTGDTLIVYTENGKTWHFSSHKYDTYNFYSLIKKENDKIFKARDNNGKLIMAYLEPVKGTPWFLYSRADVKELFQSFNKQAIFIILLTIMVLVVAITVISFLYSKQQRDIYKSLYLMFANSPQPMWIYDLNTLKFLAVNQAAIQHYGYTREEFLSMSIKDIRPKEDIPLLMKDVETTEKAYNNAGIWRHIKKNGEIIFVDIKSHLVTYNKLAARHVLANDITDIKNVQDALKESEQKFRHLFEDHSAVKIIIDPLDKSIADANEAAAKFYGYTRAELTKMNISDIDTIKNEKLEELIEDVLEKKTINFELIHRKSDGSLCDVEVFCSKINISGKYYLHSIIHDISEKKKAKEQIEKMLVELITAKNKAEESDHLKTAFLANMSHEIRTPMNGILGFMDLLRQPGLTGDQLNEYIGIVKFSGERLLSTINDIIDISKIESGQCIVNVNTVNVNEIMLGQLRFFKAEADNKNIELSISSLLNDDEKMILIDSTKLQSVIVNLLKNALKFTKKGKITYGVKLQDTKLIFEVTDTGKGIPSNRLNSIFDRFVQADISMARDYEGSGLGLSISKAYVEMMGGNICVKSELGKGSVFTFSVLYNKSDYFDEKQVPLKELPAELLLKDITILVAEDDEISYIYLNRMLSKYKVRLIRVYNGEEAVTECINNMDISLVFMDIKMPILDGYDATRAILKSRPDLPIIALTAYALSDDREKAISCGCVDYISKPVRKDILLDNIKKYALKRAIV